MAEPLLHQVPLPSVRMLYFNFAIMYDTFAHFRANHISIYANHRLYIMERKIVMTLAPPLAYFMWATSYSFVLSSDRALILNSRLSGALLIVFSAFKE